MNRKTKILAIFIGVLMTFTLFGCGKQKYKVNLESSIFECKKTEYAEGEKVTVYYDLIATDTDYSFKVEGGDVEYKVSYDDKHGYVITFTMPANDVTVSVTHVNSMVNYISEEE